MQIKSKIISLLYVENDSKVQDSIKNILSNKVDTLIIANNGNEGLDQYIKHQPDIVITSLDLPEISGFEMVENIIKLNKDIPIVLILKDEETKRLKDTINLGIDNYIFKPIQNNLLLNKLDKIIEGINDKNTIKEQNLQIKNYLDFIEKKLTSPTQNQELKAQPLEIKEEDEIMYLESERIANIGSWKHDLVSNKLYWSKGLYQILQIDSKGTKPSYDKFLTLISPSDRGNVNTIHKNSLKENRVFDINFSINLKDDSLRFLNEKFETIFDENNKPLYTIGIIQDISNYKKLYDTLSRNEDIMISQSKYATMGEIITMIMHQWRQPITTISMAANNLIVDIELEMLEASIVKKSALTIAEQTQYLSKTIDDFRSFFKNVKYIEETVMKNIFDETSKIMMTSLTNNEIELKLDFDESITIKTFSRELLQVLLNILRNAKDALVENQINNRFIQINISETSEDIEILISDNAGGIKEDVITKIFDAYFTTKDEQTGTGLGLYMSKIIIEKNLKGILKVENIEDGVTFSILLPKDIT